MVPNELYALEELARIDRLLAAVGGGTLCSLSGTPSQRVRMIVQNHQDVAARVLANAKAFRDDVLSYLRALSLMLTAVGNASTHAEKAARLRGVVELLESAAAKLRKEEFTFNRSWWHYDDVFASDYPTVHYLRRIHELEAEVKRLRGPAGLPAADQEEP